MASSDVTGEVTRRGVFALNSSKAHPAENLFIGDRRLVARSDVDSQLLVCIPFNQTLRLSGIRLDAPEDEHPTIAKLYVNAPAMGFDDVEGTEPAQVLNLSPTHFGDAAQEIKLKVTKFNRVNTLHIFFDREGADHVAVAGLKFYGAPLEGTKDLKELGKKPDGAA